MAINARDIAKNLQDGFALIAMQRLQTIICIKKGLNSQIGML